MAEIKSTLEMVMERAARMASETVDVTANDETERAGMRLAAAYLSGTEADLTRLLEDQPEADRREIRRGMAHTLLRNIVLPRDGAISEQSRMALGAVKELSGHASEAVAVCSELTQLLEQYSQHKEQVQQQFDDSIRNQLKQKLRQQGQQVEDEMSINPAMHPQYREEWNRVVSDLNEQYTEALDQRKEIIRQAIGG